IHFSAFHPDYRMKDKPKTPPSTLERARKIALERGIRYAYTGNVFDDEGDTTVCHECGEKLIVRSWYDLVDYNLDEDGRCTSCGTPLPGEFEAKPGSWGRKRKPVRLANYRRAANA
ncbi:MAG: AmmeMemoRadiSam system radical SAM enzyme, partial [Persicimonas sp.]